MMLLPKNHTKFTKNNFHVPFDCRFFLARETEISEIYQIKKKSDFISVYFGKYTNGRLLTNTTYAYEKKMNMRGEKMIMQRPDWVISYLQKTYSITKNNNSFVAPILSKEKFPKFPVVANYPIKNSIFVGEMPVPGRLFTHGNMGGYGEIVKLYVSIKT